jgi:hypothetical protein
MSMANLGVVVLLNSVGCLVWSNCSLALFVKLIKVLLKEGKG